ncbi:hypothetical protein HUK80_06220 [Flavobacterium sp. MAH-1]|uniref:HEPN domain-containing protein n=1 Tax=Flavobacterium agri TaxID=2743471 RepID=A0A7Y8Y0T6_9FLAO|nr:hypothetical protein [Flavobacterium agri]NUY80484.1 hypothetical protein [Flavobacterium agri]NYA70509.1 hypothetical protein [Flavobacterium agri]
MNHYILTPEDHPGSHLIEKAIDETLGFINADCVYLSVNNQCGPETIVTFYMDKDSTQLAELEVLADKVFAKYPAFAYRLFSCDYAEDALRKGNLFMVRHVALGSVAYANPEGGHPFFPEAAMPNRLITRAKKLFKKRLQKCDRILSDYVRCIEHENFTEAVFVLHRALEVLYKTGANFLTGRPLVSKSIAVQQENIRTFAPALGHLFDPAGEEECFLLEQLDKTYPAMKRRRFPEPKFKREDVGKILAKVALAKKEVERLFAEAVGECFRKTKRHHLIGLEIKDAENKSKAVRQKPSETNPELIVSTITKNLDTAAIYCFGKSTANAGRLSPLVSERENDASREHFYILALVEAMKENAVADISDAIRVKSDDKCTVTLLLHTVTSLRHRTDHGVFFFSEVFKKGEVLYEHETVPPGLNFVSRKRSAKVSRAYWNSRMAIAATFLDSENQIERSGVEVVKQSMLHVAAEHVCLGLIEVFLAYRPNHYGLGYLFDLCDYFTPLCREVFPRDTEEGKLLFKLLCGNMSSLRRAVPDYSDFTYTELLEKRLHLFVERANILVEEELKRTEETGHGPTGVSG